jgi:HD-GYP domain-containing protein (c-di-GMP phosphodiesterase class II)
VTNLETYEVAMAVCHPMLGGHAERVSLHAEAIARRLGWEEPKLDEVRLGAALHDVGKVALAPEVLEKPAALDPLEIEQVRAHPVEGAWLIAGVRSLAPALPYVLFHHERWDGRGYPTRRAGSHIPIEGRMMAVADAFDAMISDRPYRNALSCDEAVSEVRRCSGTQFDPEIVDAFLAAIEAGECVV